MKSWPAKRGHGSFLPPGAECRVRRPPQKLIMPKNRLLFFKTCDPLNIRQNAGPSPVFIQGSYLLGRHGPSRLSCIAMISNLYLLLCITMGGTGCSTNIATVHLGAREQRVEQHERRGHEIEKSNATARHADGVHLRPEPARQKPWHKQRLLSGPVFEYIT